jgi:hypothetical protein
MTTREPFDEQGLTRQKFKNRLLDQVERCIADDERIVP